MDEERLNGHTNVNPMFQKIRDEILMGNQKNQSSQADHNSISKLTNITVASFSSPRRKHRLKLLAAGTSVNELVPSFDSF
jgi:hypothetical protein